MIDKLNAVKARFDEVEALLCDPAVISDPAGYAALMKERKKLQPLVDCFVRYLEAQQAFDEAKGLLDAGGLDKDFRALAQEEYDTQRQMLDDLQEQLKVLLLPKDENDDKNVIVEIRGGAGGEE